MAPPPPGWNAPELSSPEPALRGARAGPPAPGRRCASRVVEGRVGGAPGEGADVGATPDATGAA